MACFRQSGQAVEDGTVARLEGEIEAETEGAIQDVTGDGVAAKHVAEARNSGALIRRHAARPAPGEQETEPSQGTQSALRFEHLSLLPWVSWLLSSFEIVGFILLRHFRSAG
jgi:hypothetical protein